MSVKINIRAKHVLLLSCPGCPDTAEYDVTGYYGGESDLLERAAAYRERHSSCLAKIDAQVAEKERQERERSKPMPAEAVQR